VTAAVARDLDDDLAPLGAALTERGIDHRVVDWHDVGVVWAGFEMVVVRSPWDYTRRYAEFVGWAEAVGLVTVLENPVDLLRWSADKRYLTTLATGGVPVVATSFAAPGEQMDWPDAAEIVVKPSISAGSLDTERYARASRDDARAHVTRLHAQGRTAMAQPYLSAVEGARGETALVYLDGAFSHALRKGPMLMPGLALVGGLYVEEDIRPAEATPAERAVADAAMAAIPEGARPLYARADLVPDDRGEPVVLELELVEPSLFLAHAPGAAQRLAGAIAARLRAGPSGRG
jgi:O-ureido-D-serine cyclo-ligase